MSKPNPSVPWIQQHGPRISLYAAAGLTLTGEFHLAVIAQYPTLLAWLFPVALDVYAAVAMSFGRRLDIVISVLLMIAAQVVYHLVEAGLIAQTGTSGIVITAITVVIPPIIVWRVHGISHKPAAKPKTIVKTVEVPVEVVKEVIKEVFVEVPVPARKTKNTAGKRATAGRGDKQETMRKIADWLTANPDGSNVACAQAIGKTPKWVGMLRAELAGAAA